MRRRRRRVLLASATALVLLLGTGGVVAAQAHKTVTLEADGETTTSGSWRGTVGGFLEDQGVSLGEHDEVIPDLETPLSDATTVEVLRAQPVDVVVDGEQDVLWTTAEDAGAALASFALEGRGSAQMVVSRSAGRTEVDLPLAEKTTIHVIDGDKNLVLAPGTTLQQALNQAGITLNDSDEISVTSAADGSSVVTIVRVVLSQRVETEVIPHTSRQVESDEYYVGTTKVTTEGVDGTLQRTYNVTTRDGQVVSDELVEEATTVPAVEEVVTVGTKKRPVATPKATTSSSSGSSSASSSSSDSSAAASESTSTVSGDVWAQLAQCESGGNPSIVSSNGKYHGLYQFTVSTWASVGGSGLPSEASAAEQTQRAQALQARSGWGQWPACARKLGLL
ncbi:DUF348 domain-containing protein [Miniimonas arenae]|uniref:DUF348 domain-containing protein n=1 Tax=Miniimonas arenae TaxID=676201 RepID=A0A5C5B9E1_9MICO|nr:DUF348 domain-containing protein [Miniimonas arenae]